MAALVSSSSDTISRAYFFDVIQSSDSINQWLGDPIFSQYDHDILVKSGSSSSITAVKTSSIERPKGTPNPGRFRSTVQELIDTERSYVKRIDVLYHQYALPLRLRAQHKTTAILSSHDADQLFGNIGEISGANHAFLNDLEALTRQGDDAVATQLGDLLFQHISCFACYSEYLASFDRAKQIERNVSKDKAFRDFTDAVKYSVTDIGNTGLRDLLMEPVQRIPRYKLLIDAMIKHLDPESPQRARLQLAASLASRIASCNYDDETQRAAVVWSLTRHIDALPPDSVSTSHLIVDCIDVDDFPIDSVAGSRTIACTILLLDDRIIIVKRAHSTSCGRSILGLDDVNHLAMQMKAVTERKATGSKTELAFRGSVDLRDVEATDLGGVDFELTFGRAPSHVTGDKWTARLVRQYMTVDASSKAPSARLDKVRFLENLWRARALCIATRQHSRVQCHVTPATGLAIIGVDTTPDSFKSAATRKLVYYSIYTLSAYLEAPHKSNVVLNVDESDRDCLAFEDDASAPFAALDLISHQSDKGEVRQRIRRRNKPAVADRSIPIAMSEIQHWLIGLARDVDKSYGTATQIAAHSNPSTPTGSKQRLKTAVGLDTFGRTRLFSGHVSSSSFSSAGVSSADIFGSPARRSQSVASKSSSTASISSRAMFSLARSSVSSKRSVLNLRQRTIDSPRAGGRVRRRSSSLGALPTDDHMARFRDVTSDVESESRHELDEFASSISPHCNVETDRLPHAQVNELTDTVASSRRPIGPRRAIGPLTDRAVPNSHPDVLDADVTMSASVPDRAGLAVKRALPIETDGSLTSSKRPSLDHGRGAPSSSSPAVGNGSRIRGSGTRIPITPARTSSVASKAQESRRRNEAVDQCLRQLKEEVKALQDLSGSSDGVHEQVRDGLSKVNCMLEELEARWISSIRMQNRMMHDLGSASMSNNTDA